MFYVLIVVFVELLFIILMPFMPFKLVYVWNYLFE